MLRTSRTCTPSISRRWITHSRSMWAGSLRAADAVPVADITLVPDVGQLDVEHDPRVRRDPGPRRGTRPVGQRRRNRQPPDTADLHADDALVEPRNRLAGALTEGVRPLLQQRGAAARPVGIVRVERVVDVQQLAG